MRPHLVRRFVRERSGRDSNLRPLGCRSDALPLATTPLRQQFRRCRMWYCYRHRLLRKSEGSAAAPVRQTSASSSVSRWIKPGEQDNDDAGLEEKNAVEDGQRREEKGGKTSSSSAPASCYSMAAAAAVALSSAGSRQRTFRTTRSFSCRSPSQLSSYDLASALQTINNIVLTNSARRQKATRLVGLEDPSASPRKRSDKVGIGGFRGGGQSRHDFGRYST